MGQMVLTCLGPATTIEIPQKRRSGIRMYGLCFQSASSAMEWLLAYIFNPALCLGSIFAAAVAPLASEPFRISQCQASLLQFDANRVGLQSYRGLCERLFCRRGYDRDGPIICGEWSSEYCPYSFPIRTLASWCITGVPAD
jgi:hypothetical protein